MDKDFSFLENLNEKQKEVCTGTDNYLLTACPGSGKTRTITYRLAYLYTKYFPSKKLNIAITYTNRAANEIYTRLENMGIETSAIWTGTIHQFCMRFIIRPYAMYSSSLKNGYRVIDEYVKNQYCKEIASALGIGIGYNDPLSYPSIKSEYIRRLSLNKEIDFDMILNLSDKLLTDFPFIAENISSIMRSIHVDEFQDTNELQYAILAKIVGKNKSINVVFVGDVNQAIYGGLGGVAKSAASLSKQFGIEFKSDCLAGCYRSTQRIVDYYRNFEISSTGVQSVSANSHVCGVIAYDHIISKDALPGKIADIIRHQLSLGIPAHEICVVAPQWYQIYPIANYLREHLPLVNFDAPDIIPFKYDPMNPFYLLARLLFTAPGTNVKQRKRTASELLEILENEYQISLPDGYDVYHLLKAVNSVPRKSEEGVPYYKQSAEYVFWNMHIPLIKESNLYQSYTYFLDKAQQRIEKYHLANSVADFYACFKERQGVVINTIHGVKGEEYETVIGFDLVNGHLPHWDYIFDSEKIAVRKLETSKLLYVLCSRAKTNLYLFSETGRITQKGFPLRPTDELVAIDYDYDK